MELTVGRCALKTNIKTKYLNNRGITNIKKQVAPNLNYPNSYYFYPKFPIVPIILLTRMFVTSENIFVIITETKYKLGFK